MGDRQNEIPVDKLLLYFTIEPVERVQEVLAAFQEKRAFDDVFTRGLYYTGTN